MANYLGAYNPTFYANQGLIWLMKALGMAGRVHMGYDAERKSFRKGDTIMIKRPSTFVAQDAPSSDQDLATEDIPMVLSYWKEVKYSLTDRELAFTQDDIIREHIAPAAYALADDIDQKLCDLAREVGPFVDLSATPGGDITDFIKPRTEMFNNKVPISDPAALHYMIGGAMEGAALALPAFSQHSGSGDVGVATQVRGAMGNRFGFNIFANQNVGSHTKGTASTTTLAVVGATARGASSITLDAGSVTGTIVRGDVFTIAGHTQKYAAVNTVTAGTNTFTGVQISPELQVDVADNAVVTLVQDDHTLNMAFHRDAFAVAFAPLSEMGNGRGAEISTAQDPVTGLTVRSRFFYMGDVSKMKVALDVLYGVKTLNPNLAVRCRG